MAKGSPNVTFRLKPELYLALSERAKARSVKERNSYARQVVIDALIGDSQTAELNLRVTNLETQIAALRSDLATAVHVLLTSIHHPDPGAKAADIAAWVTENLRRA